MPYKIIENEQEKVLASTKYNYYFNKSNGFFARWGDTKENDPNFSFFGPEIADIEIVDICHGIRNKEGKRKVCEFCYKANTPNNTGIMTLETFKKIFDKIKKGNVLTQIAFGVDSTALSNPYLFDIAKYSRDNEVIPNITVADIDEETADKLAEVMGACAISYYPQVDKNRCYDSVKLLTDRNMDQINIHAMISNETFDYTMELFDDVVSDPRLEKLNAVVMLSLKQKGRGTTFTPLSQDKFKLLVDKAFENKISFGFDSCSCFSFLDSIKDHARYKELEQMSESCESTLFSSYINTEGKFFPCSFIEGVKMDESQNWSEGIDLLEIDDFVKDVWYNPKVVEFRNKLLDCKSNCISCPHFDIRG